ncbi:putative prolyl 4-hydroxylase 9 [Abeliophyllum distichum]|uniref:Prolyl 4-hydroxylase 9 n=1 Tax=Abeliophyllum distichum TaxID=126358 RepID=A0ABD1SFT6_9LAMI
MKNKGSKIGGGNLLSLGLPSIFLLCLFFFLAGFFGSSLFSQQEVSSTLRPQPRELEEEKNQEFDVLPHGKTGEASLTRIPFQILSWNPRALYFPNFRHCRTMPRHNQNSKERPQTIILSSTPWRNSR